MTTQTPNTMPYEQSANGVGYDALQVSALVGETLPENKVIALEQTLDKLSASTSYNEQYRTALLDGDVKAAGHALKDFYLSTQIAQVAADHPLTQQTRQEMSELDAANQRAFILDNLDTLRGVFNENGEHFAQLWEKFKPTRLSAQEIKKSSQLQQLLPELMEVANTLWTIRELIRKYGTDKPGILAHELMTGCAFPADHTEIITGVVPEHMGPTFNDPDKVLQQQLGKAWVFANMLEHEPRYGEQVQIRWNTQQQLDEQEAEYERMAKELGLITPGAFPRGSVVSCKGKEIEVFKYWVAQQ